MTATAFSPRASFTTAVALASAVTATGVLAETVDDPAYLKETADAVQAVCPKTQAEAANRTRALGCVEMERNRAFHLARKLSFYMEDDLSPEVSSYDVLGNMALGASDGDLRGCRSDLISNIRQIKAAKAKAGGLDGMTLSAYRRLKNRTLDVAEGCLKSVRRVSETLGIKPTYMISTWNFLMNQVNCFKGKTCVKAAPGVQYDFSTDPQGRQEKAKPRRGSHARPSRRTVTRTAGFSAEEMELQKVCKPSVIDKGLKYIAACADKIVRGMHRKVTQYRDGIEARQQERERLSAFAAEKSAGPAGRAQAVITRICDIPFNNDYQVVDFTSYRQQARTALQMAINCDIAKDNAVKAMQSGIVLGVPLDLKKDFPAVPDIVSMYGNAARCALWTSEKPDNVLKVEGNGLCAPGAPGGWMPSVRKELKTPVRFVPRRAL